MKRQDRLRLAALGLGGLALIVILAAIFWPRGPRAQYITARAEYGDVEETVLASGVLQPKQLVEVGSQATGQIKTLAVKLNEVVKKGQLIAVIDPAPQQNNLRTAEAALAQFQAQRAAQAATLEQDQISLKRQAATLAAQASDQSDYDAADAAVKVARANLDALDAQIKQAAVAVDTAKVNLGYTNIVSPIDGVVIGLLVKEGQTVNAVQSAPVIVRIARLDVMTVKAQISEADIIKVRPGQPVYFTILGDPGRRFDATLSSLELAPESVTSEESSTTTTTSSSTTTTAVYYDGQFDAPNPDQELRTSMTTEVNIVLASRKNVLTVPSTALHLAPGPGSDGVHHIENGPALVDVLGADGKPAPRRVLVGVNNNSVAEIRSGLSESEKVVLSEGDGKAPSAPRSGPPMMGGGPPPGGR